MGFPDNFWRNLGWVVSILRFDCHKWNSYYTNHHFFLARYWSLAKTGFGIRCPPCLQNRQVLVAAPSIRLLKHVVRCYLRLCDNAHAKEVLKPHGYAGAAWGFMGFHGWFALFGAWQSWENVTCSFHHGCPHGSCASPGLNPIPTICLCQKNETNHAKPTHFPGNIKDAGLAPDHSLETNTMQTIWKKTPALRQCLPDGLQSDPSLQRLPENILRALEEDHATKRWLVTLSPGDLRWFCSIPSDISSFVWSNKD